MNITRRTILKSSVAAVGLVSTAGLSGCGPEVRTPPEKALAGLRPVKGLTRDIQKILYFASLAPSGHNAQPWAVKVADNNRLVLLFDKSRRLGVVDPDNREAFLSLGAFLENLDLAAGALGYLAEISITATTTADSRVADIGFAKQPSTGYPQDRLTTRMTVRDGYLDKPLTGSDFKKLSEPFDGRLFYFEPPTEHARCIADGTARAFKVQTDDDPAQTELARWVRFSNSEARHKRDGLTPATMGITGLVGWIVRTFYDSRDVLKPSFREKGIENTEQQVKQGGGWLIITSKGDSAADVIDTGRKFERMALTARELGLGLHPMTQMLEEKTGRQSIAAEHEQTMIPQFIIRTGYVENHPDPVSLRRPVEWFVKV